MPPRAIEPSALATTLATPWGPCQVAVTALGVVAMEILVPAEVFDARLAARAGSSTIRPAAVAPGARPLAPLLDEVSDRLRAYLAGARGGFEDLPVDWLGRPGWDRLVLEAVRAIPYGHVASYGGVARAISRPGAARAVGGAVGRNPLGFLVPCHRVIAADGSLGGYGGDWWVGRETLLAIKRDLLALEGVVVPVAVSRLVLPGLREGRTVA